MSSGSKSVTGGLYCQISASRLKNIFDFGHLSHKTATKLHLLSSVRDIGFWKSCNEVSSYYPSQYVCVQKTRATQPNPAQQRTKSDIFPDMKRNFRPEQSVFITELQIWTKSRAENWQAQSSRQRQAHMQTHKHLQTSLGQKCTESCLKGLAGQHKATNVSKNTKEGAKRRIEHGPDTVRQPDLTARDLLTLLPQCVI